MISKLIKLALFILLFATVGIRPAYSQEAPAANQPVVEQAPAVDYAAQAKEITDYARATFFIEQSGLYRENDSRRQPAFVWPGGVWFTALVGAARHDGQAYRPAMDGYFKALDQYWDTEVAIPGYEPAPKRGGGNDKYYDDNAWMVITFLEAYEATGEAAYLKRAEETLAFTLSGWDDQLGGGIWWHEQHKDGTKNVCINAPAAVGCLLMAKFKQGEERAKLVQRATDLVDWTVEKLQADDGLFDDRIVVATGEVKRGKLTYNTALMIRAMLGLYRETADQKRLDEAKRIAKASDFFLSNRTGAYRDNVQWSHLLVEADLELYRITQEPYLMERAKANAEYQYARWQREKPRELMANASIARILWLMSDTQTEAGQEFWKKSDDVKRPAAEPATD